MTVINLNPPDRPDCCTFDGIASLYIAYEALVESVGGKILSSCGHEILIFDHHFFHLAAISRPPETVLSMPGEKAEIIGTTNGYGRYVLGHKGSRARNLPSAFSSMKCPDEVWVDNPRVETAKWVYVKQFNSKPYPYTIVLMGERPHENGIIVPFSSFQCNARDLKRWRLGESIHIKQNQPPEGS